MFIVHVHVHIKPEFVEAFRRATLENARHKETTHYQTWNNAVAEMMAEPPTTPTPINIVKSTFPVRTPTTTVASTASSSAGPLAATMGATIEIRTAPGI